MAIFVYGDRLLYVNPAYERLTGYSFEELAADPWKVTAESERDAFRSRFEGPESGGAHFEAQLVHRDETRSWLAFSIANIDFEGQPALLAMGTDITDQKRAVASLKTSEERLELAQRAARSVVWEWDLDTDELTTTRLADEMAGFEFHRDVRTGAQFQEMIHPEDRDAYDAALRRVYRRGGSLAAEIRVVLPSGALRWLAERADPVIDDKGRVCQMIGVAHDITERKLAEEALFRETERAQVTLASIGDGVIRTDSRGAVDYLNPVAEKLTGWPLAQAYGRSITEVFQVKDADTDTSLLDPATLCLREKRHVVFPGSRLLLQRNGVDFAIQDSAAPIRDRSSDVIGAIIVFKDLSKERQMEQEMLQLANHDALTGLLNRRTFETNLEDALDSARSSERTHAFCYLDLDQFKIVNDTCGHEAGDQLIKEIATIISARLGEKDVLARMGGDEFGVLLYDRSPREARTVAEQISESVRAFHFSWDDRVFSLGTSVGLVPITGEDQDLTSLLSSADAACYVAKETGRNRIHEFEPGDTVMAERYGEMQWISRIHKALADDRLCLYRQSIVPMSPNASLSPMYELLVRMIDEDGNLVSPGSFIPAAERYHLVSSIDKWVVHNALATLKEIDEDAYFVLNVSGQSLSEESFLAYVASQFKESGAPPERVLFEITESAAIADRQNALRFIWVCKGLGCRFVLDDFGKGLSSYSYLKNLPVDLLKIEGEFVRRMADEPIEAAIVSSINQIGHVMGIETIAECVETEAVLEAARELGIDYAQGFRLHMPEPLVATPAKINR